MSFSSEYHAIVTVCCLKLSDTGLANSQIKLDIPGNLLTNFSKILFQGVAVQKTVVGAVLSVDVTCQDSDCRYTFHASSSEKISTQMYGLNYMLSCAILFAEGTVRKIFR